MSDGATGIAMDLLDCKFAALEEVSYSYSSTAQTPVLHDHFPRWGGTVLTARTRSNEVLPAFCKPIMVISISVALGNEQSASGRFDVGEMVLLFRPWGQV